MPSTEDITEQITELEGKALTFITDAQGSVVEYVGKLAETLAARLPEDRPAPLAQGLQTFAGQVDFAKKVLDAQTDFVKSVLDALVAPVKPVVVKKSVKVAA